jgi:Uma2 family endonuclease
MAMYITDPFTIDRIKAQRAESGADRHDEVWDGVYIVSPLANNEHQKLILRFTAMFQAVVDDAGLGQSFPGVNVSDREDDWTKNYREPDVAVFLEGTTARDMDTHWLGGPDFAIEIVSPNDRAREKLEFYAKVHVRELLVVDRDPWRIELYRLARRRLALVDISTPEEGESIASKVLPLTFRLVSDRPRPTIEVVHFDGRRWEI